MNETTAQARKTTLDKDLEKLVHVEEAASFLARGLVAPGLGLVFLALSGIVAALFVMGEPGAVIIIAAAAIGGYMALNIGANDVANNVGPAVGANALTMGGALAIAAVFESAGALIAGADVVTTISSGIVDPAAVADRGTFIRLMLAALISSALWINLATWIGAPVSTTHAVVGGVAGAGIAAAGFAAIDWATIGGIAVSWVISPILGGIVAMAFLAFIKANIIYRDDKIAAARLWVPILIAVMAGAFSAYLATKGLKRLIEISNLQISVLGIGSFILVWGLAKIGIEKQAAELENRNQSLRKLFRLPLVFSAALLSFAHGANDVSNAVGPLAAIVHAAAGDPQSTTVSIPLWVMVIGAFGISLGLVLFGPKLIRMVGGQITKLNPMRAFCVALSAAITVIVASWFGLPVSSTHIAVGAVFGVGFFREWYTANSSRRRAYLERRARKDRPGGERKPAGADVAASAENAAATGEVARVQARIHARVSGEEIARRRLVRRAHVMTIATAWVTTVPVSALIAAGIFLLLQLLA
jgi:PiT family inorganic phosphate transporter